MSEKQSGNIRAVLFRDRNFRWLLGGGAVSMLGDQFTLIALPWLVLKLTGDTLALGIVLAVIGVPRAIFILIGGAVVDRHSPKRVLMWTKYINTVLLGLLAVLVLTASLNLLMVYGLALGLGLSTAFSIPSGTSIMAHVVKAEQLQAANSVMLGIRQLSMFAGPLLAGLLIALFGDGATAGAMTDAKGLGFAFLFDSFSYALSAWTLSRVAVRMQSGAPLAGSKQQHVLKSVGDGLRHCWNDRSMRACFFYWSAATFFVTGPIHVAMPVLAEQLGHGAAAFGTLAGAYGAGTLIGMAISGIKPDLRIGNFGLTMLLVDCVVGALFIPMGLIDATWQGALLLLTIGAFGGFMQVMVYTWMQRRVKPAMLGRVMSVFMFIFMGIAPISSAITGWLMRNLKVNLLFAGSGALLMGIALIALATSSIRTISDWHAHAETEH